MENETVQLSQQQRRRIKRNSVRRQRGQEAKAHNLCSLFKIRGALDVDCLESALQAVLIRHPALRLAYSESVADPETGWLARPSISIARFTGPPALEDIAALQSTVFTGEELKVTAALWNLDDDSWMLSLVADHLVMDGRSWWTFHADLSAAYHDPGSYAAETSPSYFDFVNDQSLQLQGKELELRLDYWRSRLDPLRPFGEEIMPGAQAPVTDSRTARRAICTFDVDARRRARGLGVTPFAFVLSALLVARARHGTSVCTTHLRIDTRPHDFQSSIGWFGEGLIHRYRVIPSQDFSQVCRGALRTVFSGAGRVLPTSLMTKTFEPDRALQRSWRPVCFVDVRDSKTGLPFKVKGAVVREEPNEHRGVALEDGAAFFFEMRGRELVLTLQFEREAWSDQDAGKFLSELATVFGYLNDHPDPKISDIYSEVGTSTSSIPVDFES